MPRPAEPAHRAVRVVRQAPRRGCQLLHGLRRRRRAPAREGRRRCQRRHGTAPNAARARVARANTLAEKKINTTSKLVINEFSLNDATLEILVPNTKKIVTLGLPPIYLKDIGSVEGGVLPNELVKIIIERIKKKIINEEINELVNYKKQIEKTKDAINDYKSKTKEKIRNKINEKINNIF